MSVSAQFNNLEHYNTAKNQRMLEAAIADLLPWAYPSMIDAQDANAGPQNVD